MVISSCNISSSSSSSNTSSAACPVEPCDSRSWSFRSFNSCCSVLCGVLSRFVRVFVLAVYRRADRRGAPVAAELETRSLTVPTSRIAYFSYFSRWNSFLVELKDEERRRTRRGFLRLQLRGFLEIFRFSLCSVFRVGKNKASGGGDGGGGGGEGVTYVHRVCLRQPYFLVLQPGIFVFLLEKVEI